MDEASLREVLEVLVAEYQASWNEHDAKALTEFFAGDADLIMGTGPTIGGREAIQEWWTVYFDRVEAGSRAAFLVDDIRPVGSDAAVVNVTAAQHGDQQDRDRVIPLARGTWVMVRAGEAWRVAAMRGQPLEGAGRQPGDRMLRG